MLNGIVSMMIKLIRLKIINYNLYGGIKDYQNVRICSSIQFDTFIISVTYHLSFIIMYRYANDIIFLMIMSTLLHLFYSTITRY